MTANDYRATINMPAALRTDIREFAIEATRTLGREVSFQDAARAILLVGVSDPKARDFTLHWLRAELDR